MPGAGRLSVSQHAALTRALCDYDRFVASSNPHACSESKDKNFANTMADAIASLEAAKFSKPPKESWFTRIRTLSTWFSVKHDEFARQVVCDMSTDKLVVPEQAWEALIFETFETEANQHSTLTQKLIQSTVDKLSETHSMDGRRFGIPASFVKAKVSSRIPSLAAGRQGTDQSARGVPKPSLTCLDIHFFLNVAKALGDDGWTPQLVIDGEYNNDCALAHSGRVAAVFVTISFYPYSRGEREIYWE